MEPLPLHELHASLGAAFADVRGAEVVDHYGDPAREHAALRGSAGVVDLGFRGRICLTGADRVRLLHGQVTNDIRGLAVGSGCYTAMVTNKGKMLGDANVYALAQELLLDVEPGTGAVFRDRLEHHIVADDVQVVDAAPYYGLLSVQGPRAAAVVGALEFGVALPDAPLGIVSAAPDGIGDVYLANQPRVGRPGFDLFVPMAAQGMVLDRLVAAARSAGGGAAGWRALELARIEAGIPRFGADMDDSNLPPEAGIEGRAVSLDKGCYTGQEILARLRTYGQVARALRGLRVDGGRDAVPPCGARVLHAGKDVGHVTGGAWSDAAGGVIAMAYVRRECFQPGKELQVASAEGRVSAARIVPLPFVP